MKGKVKRESALLLIFGLSPRPPFRGATPDPSGSRALMSFHYGEQLERTMFAAFLHYPGLNLGENEGLFDDSLSEVK